jgi:transposase InsO family protein
VQYASRDYTGLLEENGIAVSMSRKGNPWDNAACESLMKTSIESVSCEAISLQYIALNDSADHENRQSTEEPHLKTLTISECVYRRVGAAFLRRLEPTGQRFGLGANAPWQPVQSARSLNPRPLKIIGTHFSARAARVFACFAPEI